MPGPDLIWMQVKTSTAARACATGCHAANDDQAFVEQVAKRYDRCHPDDSFRDLVRRSSFSKEDRRLMQDWLEAGRGWDLR